MLFLSSNYLLFPFFSSLLAGGRIRTRIRTQTHLGVKHRSTKQLNKQRIASSKSSHKHQHHLLRQFVAGRRQQPQQSPPSLLEEEENADTLAVIPIITSSPGTAQATPVSLHAATSAIWIDFENVRGKTGFALNHEQLLTKIETWITYHHVQEQVIVVIDHGGESRTSSPCAYYIQEKQYAIIFSGNAKKADDILAHGIGNTDCFPFFHAHTTVLNNEGTTLIVTADNELISRCRRATKQEYHFISPQSFLDDLDYVGAATKLQHKQERLNQCHSQQPDVDGVISVEEDDDDENDDEVPEEVEEEEIADAVSGTTTKIPTILPALGITLPVASEQEHEIINALDTEIKLRAKLLDAQKQMGDKRKRKSNKKRKSLENKVRVLQRRLALRGPSLLDQLTNTNHSEPNSTETNTNTNSVLPGSLQSISREQQDIILERWREIQQRPISFRNRKEQTGDRILYAERLRRTFDTTTANAITYIEQPTTAEEYLPSAMAFVNHINGHNNRNNNNNGRPTMGNSRNSLLDQNTMGIVNNNNNDRRRSSNGSPALQRRIVSSLVLDSVNDEEEENNTAQNTIPSVVPPKLSTEEQLLLMAEQHEQKKMTTPVITKQTIGTLDIVVVSDTHGFEGQLGPTLPDGDVLLHLGDYAYEGSSIQQKQSLIAFDTWLATAGQHIPYKIVIRGNHDPFQYPFPVSKAMYITQPKILDVLGYSFLCLPHGNARKLAESGLLNPTKDLNAKTPQDTTSGIDVIASHCPPYKILDKTYTGKHVGSSMLSNVLRKSRLLKAKLTTAPTVWFVGHIHEGRGIATKHLFGHREATTVINAANANDGYATHLVHGPVVVRIQKDSKNNSNNDNGQNVGDDDTSRVKILQMDDTIPNGHNGQNQQASFFNDDDYDDDQEQHDHALVGTDDTISNGNTNDDAGNHDDASSNSSNTNKLLLSVDLGMKSGLSLFSNDGNLIRYEQFHFIDRDKLVEDLVYIMYQWEIDVDTTMLLLDDDDTTADNDSDANTSSSSSSSSLPHRITHIAIEGGDTELLDIWSTAADTYYHHSNNNGNSRPQQHHRVRPNIVRISPEEWRAELLTKKEATQGGRTAKEASRLIARQIVYDYGVNTTIRQHVGKFPTDVAESVCLGMYVSRRLGWMESREPPIRRYTNGNVIVPAKQK